MYLIWAEGYKNANVNFLIITITSKISISIKDVGSGMGVKNLSDLVLKEMHGICETKNPTKNKLMKKRQMYKKFTNLSQKLLHAKNNKKALGRNDVTTTIIKRCRGEKQEV